MQRACIVLAAMAVLLATRPVRAGCSLDLTLTNRTGAAVRVTAIGVGAPHNTIDLFHPATAILRGATVAIRHLAIRATSVVPIAIVVFYGPAAMTGRHGETLAKVHGAFCTPGTPIAVTLTARPH